LFFSFGHYNDCLLTFAITNVGLLAMPIIIAGIEVFSIDNFFLYLQFLCVWFVFCHKKGLMIPMEYSEAVMEEIIKPILPAQWLSDKTQYHINPTGAFEIGGPVRDAGLTGRKIIVY
jgi:hypothetical protein